LDEKAYAKYPALSELEVQRLVVDDKWLASLDAAIHGEMDRISQALTARVKELAERYDSPLPELAQKAADIEQTVNGHLINMGLSWS
jgi:type I restriction enzyme M protein